MFPGGFLYLACVASDELLDEQRRVDESVRPLAVEPWPHFEPGTWTPHVTTGWALSGRRSSRRCRPCSNGSPSKASSRRAASRTTTREYWTDSEEAPLDACDGRRPDARPYKGSVMLITMLIARGN